MNEPQPQRCTCPPIPVVLGSVRTTMPTSEDDEGRCVDCGQPKPDEEPEAVRA